MSHNKVYIALDVGEKRIGVAKGDTGVRLAFPVTTIDMGDDVYEKIEAIFKETGAAAIVIGYPRNQSGETTAQSAYVEKFADTIDRRTMPVIFQDESLTSVLAEQRLAATGRPYNRGDIDATAAAIILQDYLELHHD